MEYTVFLDIEWYDESLKNTSQDECGRVDLPFDLHTCESEAEAVKFAEWLKEMAKEYPLCLK